MLMMKRILAILAVSMVGAVALGCGDETGTSGSGGAGGGGGGAGGESGGAGGGSGGAGGGSGGSAATGCERFGYVASGMSCDPGCTAVMCECDPFPRSITACTADGCIVAATCSEVCAASSLMEAVDCTDTYVVQGGMP